MKSAIVWLSFAAVAASFTACPESAKTAYFVVDNTELVTAESIEFKDFSEEECQSTCSSNVDSNGKSIECASFAYDHVSFTCTVYATKSLPEGKAATKSAIGKRFFEKFCLTDAAVVPTCSEAQFIRADDSVLIGFAANVSLVDSLEECVSTCVKESACKSAMYFYEEGECITNTESALSRPSSFAREETEKVIYFQNGCLARSAFIESSSSKPLANVDFESSTKAKTRGESASAELPLSGEEDEEEEEEPVTTTTTKAPKKRRSKTTTAAPTTTTTTTTEAPEDLEEEYDEEEPTTTVASKKKGSKREEKDALKKFQKHPKNFGSKTVHYKAKKGEKVDVPKVDKSAEEEVDPASFEAVDDETIVETDPYTTFFSDWSDWTPCKTSGERRIRRRKCLDLRRCLGALMQVENCPAITTRAPELVNEEELKSERSIVAAPLEGDSLGGIDTITSAPEPEAEIAAVGTAADVGDGYIWSPWLGTCQKFASGQPCNNNEMIGFESRECVAKDPSQCQGPFFRYCTLPC